MSFVGSAIGTGIAAAADSLIGDIAAPYALFWSATRFIGTIVPDVTVREIHTDEFTITQFPVESGTPISDHVFANPQIIEISCGFSDSSGGYAGYVQEAYQDLLALSATRQTFDVSCGKRYYTSMLFSNITVVTDETSEFALMVTARLQQVIISDTDASSGSDMTQANQASPADTSPTVNTGQQGLQAAPTAPSFAANQATFGPR